MLGWKLCPVRCKKPRTGWAWVLGNDSVRLELPLALRVVLAGVRVSAIYTIGTATVAPIIGAGGLGVPIIAGLTNRNLAYVLEGAVPVALLALVVDFALGRLEVALTPTGLD